MKTEKLLIVPDVHGRTFWKEPVNKWDGDIIFLGDYLDPYPAEDISFSAALRGLRDIIELKKERPDKVTLLCGNHDIHYIWEEAPISTRHSRMFAGEVLSIFEDNPNFFQIAKMVEQDGKHYLFTHAGVTDLWIKSGNLTLPNEVDKIESWLEDMENTAEGRTLLSQVGYSRWGNAPSGGPMWADFYDDHHPDEQVIPGVYQIFGHTGSVLNDTRSIGKYAACIDKRKAFILEKGQLTDAIKED